MSSSGLSLVGFMEHQQAITHLQQDCIPASTLDTDLLAEWSFARQKLGAPFANFGNPNLQRLPPQTQTYIQNLQGQQWVSQVMSNPEFGFKEFCLVEIDPLLAFQFTINGVRSGQHGTRLNTSSTIADHMELCLPTTPPSENFTIQKQGNALIIKAKSLNLRLLDHGMYNARMAGVLFGPALPLVIVSIYNGRYFLTNGYHRAFCMRAVGETYMPCVLRTANNSKVVGIADIGTFGLPLLESSDPPTLGHFTQGRAHDVMLKSTSRIIHVNWSEWVVSDE